MIESKEKTGYKRVDDLNILQVHSNKINPFKNENNHEYFKSIRNTQKTDDSICDVCLDSYGYEDDELILCELCNSAVHQSCFGSDLNIIPEGNWYCKRCTFIKLNDNVKPSDVKCYFCPDLKGIMNKIGDNRWAHIVCVNWIPEIYFVNDNKDLINHNSINKDRILLKCSICRIEQGSCIQCDENDCSISFHVKCAQKEGLIVNWNEMEKNKSGDFIQIRCNKHKKMIERAKFLQKKRDKSLIDILYKKKLHQVKSNKDDGSYQTPNEAPSNLIKKPKNINPPILKLKGITSHSSYSKSSKAKLFNVTKTDLIEGNNEQIMTNVVADEKKYLSIPNKDNQNSKSFQSKINYNQTDEVKTNIIPTQINFNTFNFSNTYPDNTTKLIIEDKIKKDKLNQNINEKTYKNDSFNKNIGIELHSVKDMKTNESCSKFETRSKINLNDKHDLKKKVVLKNSDLDKNTNVDLTKEEKKFVNYNNEQDIYRNKFKSDIAKNSNLSDKSSSQFDKKLLDRDAAKDKILNVPGKKNYRELISNEQIYNIIKKEENSNRYRRTNDLKKSISKMKFVGNKESSNHNPMEEKYFIKPELGKILNIHTSVLFSELICKFKTYLIDKNILENKEYVLLFKDPKLKEIFKTDFFNISDLNEKLIKFVDKIEKQQNKDIDLVKSDKKPIRNQNHQLVNEHEQKSYLSGWNIHQDKNIKDIDIRRIHRVDVINKRCFFIKDECVKLIKF